MEAGRAVVDMQAATVFPRPTRATAAAVSCEDGVAEAVKAGAGVQGRTVTGGAQPATGGRIGQAAKTE
jgi:hypothetical protein